MRTKAAMFAVGAAAGWMLVGGAAPAAASPDPATASSKPGVGILDNCAVWADYAYGRGRAHASCPGFEVSVRAYCADGAVVWSSPRWRDNYNKAECPAGVGVIAFERYTRDI